MYIYALYLLVLIPSLSFADGAVTFQSAARLDTYAFSTRREVRIVDLNGDGRKDLVVASYAQAGGTTGTLAWYENNGAKSPGFIKHPVPTKLSWIKGLDVGDINGDGAPDLLAYSVNDDSCWYRNSRSSQPTFAECRLTSAGTFAARHYNPRHRLGDLNGDGALDVIMGVYHTKDITAPNGRPNSFLSVEWLKNGGGASPRFSLQGTPPGPADISEAYDLKDFNNDGRCDVLSNFSFTIGGSGIGRTLCWYENKGAGAPFAEHVIGMVPILERCRAARLDGNSSYDLYGNGFDWYRQSGVSSKITFTRYTTATPARDPNLGIVSEIGAADLNQDGRLDQVMAYRKQQNSEVVWYENNGANPPLFVERLLASTPMGANDPDDVMNFDIGDLDGDGDNDIVQVFSDKLVWYRNLFAEKNVIPLGHSLLYE